MSGFGKRSKGRLGISDSDQLSHVLGRKKRLKKAMKLQILMAGNYDISKGKKIDFCFDEQKNIYIASCEKAAFGLLKTLVRGNRAQLRKMGTSFSGTAIKVLPEKHYMMVKVPAKRRQKMNGQRKNRKSRKAAA